MNPLHIDPSNGDPISVHLHQHRVLVIGMRSSGRALSAHHALKLAARLVEAVAAHRRIPVGAVVTQLRGMVFDRIEIDDEVPR
jgi:hypothetical protein